MTKIEFRANVHQMLWQVAARVNMAVFQPWFSFDNNYAQHHADLTFQPEQLPAGCDYMCKPDEQGIPVWDIKNVRLPLPKYSPDCHRVIEHIFGQLSFKLHREMYRRQSQLEDAQAIADFIVQQFASLQPESIGKDAAGLPDLYKWIVDHQGAWPPRKMR
jgi:hypothetical protein